MFIAIIRIIIVIFIFVFITSLSIRINHNHNYSNFQYHCQYHCHCHRHYHRDCRHHSSHHVSLNYYIAVISSYSRFVVLVENLASSQSGQKKQKLVCVCGGFVLPF